MKSQKENGRKKEVDRKTNLYLLDRRDVKIIERQVVTSAVVNGRGHGTQGERKRWGRRGSC